MKNYKVAIQTMVYITYDVQAENAEQATRKAEYLFNDDRKNYTISSDDITLCREDGGILEMFEPEEQ